MADYSLLTTDCCLLTDFEQVQNYLTHGIKVIAFGSEACINSLRNLFSGFSTAHLLQTFTVDAALSPLTIIDGKMTAETQARLFHVATLAKDFNFEQYIIEHADAYNNLIIEAGAGTGKTTVMIDRILFLLHTVPNLSLEDIGMITFTNEATQHMKHKIQDALITRYKATHSPRYLQFLEDSSKLNIQTIHSFSRDIINELGSCLGYANTIDLKGFKYQRKQLIHDVLNDAYLAKPTAVDRSLGARLNDLDSLIQNFWTQLENIGLTDEEIQSLDWGLPNNSDSKALHQTLSHVFPELNLRYNDLKMQEDSIAVGDIVRELRRILDSKTEIKIKSKQLKYLFVDEFQDSDNAQIKTIAWLQKHTNLYLFAVGDVKQSIYRFRGAVETAFNKLRTNLEHNGCKTPQSFTLTRNYRTSPDVLNSLDPIFRHLESGKLLDYGNSLIPQKTHSGSFRAQYVRNSESVYSKETVNLLLELLDDCGRNAAENNTEKDPQQHVTVLTRTNYQLSKIGQWCRDSHVPCYIKQEGTFYASQAVRDFYCLVKAFLFPGSNVHLFDFLNSAYSCSNLDLSKIPSYCPDSNVQREYLLQLASNEHWARYQKDFRLKPVLAVLRELVDEKSPSTRFIEKRRQILEMDPAWKDSVLNTQLAIEGAQYEADLEKLLEIIRQTFSGQMVSLYQIYNYLQIQILTNREEDEPDISDNAGCHCVYGMTVHKAKGLEFDTVVLPLTQREFRKEIDTELLLDESTTPARVGWSRVEWGNGWNNAASQQSNTYYRNCLEKEFKDVDREEARLLYVALTRSIRRLECFIIGNNEHSWAHMLEV